MKSIFSLLLIVIGQVAFSQLIIGNTSGTALNKTSVLLEFANDNNKGIILPYTRSLPSSPTEGTLLVDASTSTTARVKYFNGSWFDLSGQDADISSTLSNQPTNSQVPESTEAKVIVGANASAADGILVLESNSKAMVLPIVENTDNIVSPSPGMMVFINKTGAKRLAFFNGNKWSYWKP